MQEIADQTNGYPRFADGRIDYSNEKMCFVVNCTTVCGDSVLLTHRSSSVIAYPNTWNGISGFIDNIKPLIEIVADELKEEAGIADSDIYKIKIYNKMVQVDDTINREWHVYPAIAWLNSKVDPRINWENKAIEWISINDVVKLNLMPGYRQVFETLKPHILHED